MISIVIPAHNEERRIGSTLEKYLDFFLALKKLGAVDFEIVVVLNACRDRTREVVERYKCKELKILEFKRGGKGFAVIEGFKEGLKNSELIGYVDADMATTPEAFYDLVKNINRYDGVIASRYVKGAVVKPKQTLRRIIVSRVFNFMIRSSFFLPYRDTQCGAKLFKRKAIEKVLARLGMTQWAFDIDLLYNLKKLGFKIKEHATVWKDKEASKLNLKKASIQMFLAIIQLRVLNSPVKKAWWFFKPIAGFMYGLVTK